MRIRLKDVKENYVKEKVDSFQDVCRIFHKDFDDIQLHNVVSYATRPMRSSEINGREHIFISKEEAKDILENNDIIAYTKIGDNQYFTTKECLDGKNLYIINPDGIRYMKDKIPNRSIYTIYIHCGYMIRKERARLRSDIKSFDKRNEDEAMDFDLAQQEGLYDLWIDNEGSEEKDIIDNISRILFHIKKQYEQDPNTLFLFVGRTGAGKDMYCNEVRNIINQTMYSDPETTRKHDVKYMKNEIIKNKLIKK